ncbi:hypothetical protein FAI40_00725 [Acetobacteraceae bacterium]|nr:hypothetical protein FAI40_00725 [Acetobacteraceae bacterium]
MSKRISPDNIRAFSAALKCLCETEKCLISIDIKDLETIINDGGIGFFGVGQSLPDDPREERTILAAERALDTSILERRDLHGARNLIVLVRARKGDLRLKENTRALDYIQDSFKEEIQGKFVYSIVETDDVEENCVEIAILASFGQK